jgi:hypothetical protein
MQPTRKAASMRRTRDWFGLVLSGLVAVVIMPTLTRAESPASAAAPDLALWFPLRGVHELGCSQSNPSPAGDDSCAGYHSLPALDIDASVTDDVYAAAAGVVHQTGSTYVKVRHSKLDGTSFYTYYEHLSTVAVKTGDLATTNTSLGKAGDRGSSTPDYVHLHFEAASSPTFFTANSNFVEFRACVNGLLKTYPKDLGYSSWSEVPRNITIQHDNTDCVAAASEHTRSDVNADGVDDLLLRRGNFWYGDFSADGTTNRSFAYGDPADQVYIGWFGGDNGHDILLRRGNTWYLDLSANGTTDRSFVYGASTDQVYIGWFGGDKDDDILLRRGNTWYLDLSTNGTTDRSFIYGDPTDEVISALV